MRGVNALLLLVLVWAVMVVPTALRSRERSPQATVGGFERAMNVLRGDPGGRVVDADGRPIDVAAGPVVRSRLDGRTRRLMQLRRARFQRLVLATLAAAALGVALGGVAWSVPAVTLVITLSYATVLRRAKVQRVEARRRVAALSDARADADARTVADDDPFGVGPGERDAFDAASARPAARAAARAAAGAGAGAGAGGDWAPGQTVRLRRWDG